jgi:hypothetical protein
LVALRFTVLFYQADVLEFRRNDEFVTASVNGCLWQAWAALAEAIEQTGMSCARGRPPA